MKFTKAVKTKSRLRLAIDGISGSGKTFTALAIASGMGGPVALIDSEHGSASLYADRFEFDTVDLMSFQIEDYIEALKAAASAKYPVVIIDSTSHAWDALVERVDQIASTLTGGNTSFRAWAQGTPLQKQLIEALLNYPGHIIVTCRSKTEYSIDKDEKGKTTINKVGTAAVQRAGFEYEFTMAMTMDGQHIGHVTKDRTGKFQDKFIKKPGMEFGKELIAWLNEGAAPPDPPPSAKKKDPEDYTGILEEIGAVLKAEISGKQVFTDDEKAAASKAVKENLKKISKDRPDLKVAYLTDVLKEKKTLLGERMKETEKEKPASPSMYTEPEPEAPTSEDQVPADDHFEDDIPWGDDDKKGKPGKGTKSLPKAEPVEASTELDIF